MVIAVTPGETWEWIHDSDIDLPPEKQTVFVIRVLTDAEQRRCANRAMGSSSGRGRRRRKGEEQEFLAGDYQHQVIMMALVDVRNLRYLNKESGKIEALPFETEELHGRPNGPVRQVTTAFLDRIPQEVKVELAQEIIKGNALEEEDLKN